jgi:hypothetical protein
MNGIADEIIAKNQDAVLGLGGRPDGDAEREQDHPRMAAGGPVPWTNTPFPPRFNDSTRCLGASAFAPPPCTACAGMLPSARWSLISRPALFLIHRRSFRAPTKALNHCVEVVRQQDRERFLCNTCALSGPVESILSPTHGGTYLADLLRTRRGRRCSPCTVRDHLQRPRPPTEAMATNTSVRLNPIKTTVSRA